MGLRGRGACQFRGSQSQRRGKEGRREGRKEKREGGRRGNVFSQATFASPPAVQNVEKVTRNLGIHVNPTRLLNSPIKHSDADTKNREGEEDPCRKWGSGVWQQSCSGCPAPTLFSLSTPPPMPSTPAPTRRGGPWRNRNPARENLFRTGTSPM